jgi:site-specific DNA recombinase
MVHTYTSRNRKRYRYYVCLNAQQRGWSSCPSKSLNAQEIEAAVVQHIRGIGNNEKVIAATVAKVRQAGDRRLADLETGQRAGKRELKRLNTRVQKLVSGSFSTGSNKGLALDQLADLQDRIRSLEQRMTVVREEIITIQSEAIDGKDIRQAMAAFDPVWESLTPREQSRIIRLLIERVGYDGRDGQGTVTFRSPGVKALCGEAGS